MDLGLTIISSHYSPVDGGDPEPVLQAGQAGHTQGVVLGVATRAPRVLVAVHLLKLTIRIVIRECKRRERLTQM